MGHRRAIGLRQEVVEQVGAEVQQQEAIERRLADRLLPTAPVRVDRSDPARWTATPTAHGTRGLGDADGLAVILPSADDLVAGDLVTVTRW